MTNPQEPRTLSVSSYTEATHTVYADVAGHASLQAGRRSFTPGRITVKYDWRTQLGHQTWQIGNIEVSGLWDDPAIAAGSGMLILNMNDAPEWACEIARANMPTSILIASDGSRSLEIIEEALGDAWAFRTQSGTADEADLEDYEQEAVRRYRRLASELGLAEPS